jgi:hypothetical protein
MFREVFDLPQIPGERRRRWFRSRSLDLIVWYEPPASPHGFQLCYNVGGDEKALNWRAPASFSHTGIDGGESRPFRHKGAPILVRDGHFDAEAVSAVFRSEGTGLPADIVALVLGKLAQCGH